MIRNRLREFFVYIPRIEARAALISIAVGVTMLAVKFLAYARTGSTAILSDALEGIVNVVAAGFATYSLATAHRVMVASSWRTLSKLSANANCNGPRICP